MASESEVAELRRTIEQLQHELDSSQANADKLETDKRTLEEENARLNGIVSQFAHSKERIQELEQTNANLNAQISNFQATADELARLRENLATFESSSDEYRTLSSQLQQEKADLEQQLTEKGSELTDALSQIATLSNGLDALNAEKLRWGENEAEHKTDVPDENTSEAARMKKELENSQKAIEVLNNQFQIAQQESFELYSALAETQEAYETAAAEAEESVTLLRSQSRELEATKQAINVLNENFYRLQEENFELSASLAETAEDRDIIEAELEMKDTVDESEVVHLRKQVSASEQAVEILNNNYYALQDEHFELMESLYETQETVEQLQAEKEATEERLSVLQAGGGPLLPETESKTAEVLSPPEEIEEQAETLKEEADLELKNVGGLLGQMKAKFASMEARIAELEEEKTELIRQQSNSDPSNPFEGSQSIALENDDLKKRLEELRSEYDRLSEQSISDSMSIRSLTQDYETLNSSHQRLRQEKAGLENILGETRSRLEQYDQQVRMLMDANAELEETRHNLRQAQEETKKLKAELEEGPNNQQEQIRSLQHQLESMRLELEEQESQRQSYVEQAAKKDMELRQTQARLIELESAELQSELEQALEEKEEEALPMTNPTNTTADSIEMDEADGPEISDRFSLTQRTSEVGGNGKLLPDGDMEAADEPADEYDFGDLESGLEEPAEQVDPHAFASDGKEIDPADVERSSPSGGAFRVHMTDADQKEFDPAEVPIEIRSESSESSGSGQRMSVTMETARRISYVEEDDVPQQPRMPEIMEDDHDHPHAIPADDPHDIDI